ncbi:hypothetical protein [Dokdonia pacifica]|uniref:Uncharacterized protein n=1 Tax=Dokdonia pacifica TaxID=1627892 RepID=A0A239BIB4_9FLAO|nr:hypothetical protein [Dokdonia pacifica]SNS06783.1 hypothetical protein SAMN06265376_106145 [Dokdonia pacifica]
MKTKVSAFQEQALSSIEELKVRGGKGIASKPQNWGRPTEELFGSYHFITDGD